MSKPLPCPFCGSNNLLLSHGNQVLCVECGAEGPTVPRSTSRDNFSATKEALWNRREPSAPKQEAPPAADNRPRAICGHVAYRGDITMCIQDGCDKAAYQVMIPAPAPERRDTPHAFVRGPAGISSSSCVMCGEDSSHPIHTQPDPGGAR